MSNFRTIDRQTGFLLPPSVDEWLPERHLATIRRRARILCRRGADEKATAAASGNGLAILGNMATAVIERCR
jgi:hypothetical protein